MRICVTVNSDNPVIDDIYHYCQVNGIVMYPSSYIYVGTGYWCWRILSEPRKELTWLLLRYGEHLVIY